MEYPPWFQFEVGFEDDVDHLNFTDFRRDLECLLKYIWRLDEELVYLFISSEIDGLALGLGAGDGSVSAKLKSDGYVMSVLRTYEIMGDFFKKDDL